MKNLNLVFLLIIILAIEDAFTLTTFGKSRIQDNENEENETELYTNYDLIGIENGNEQTCQQDSKFIFTEALGDNWKNAAILMEFSRLTPNIKVKWTIYNLLWHEIKTTKLIRKPFSIISLYVNMQKDLLSLNEPLASSDKDNFAKLQKEMYEPIITTCAKQLQAVFFVDDTSNSFHFPVIQKLLLEMQTLDEVIFGETMDTLYEAIEDFLIPAQIANTLTKFSPDTKQSITAIMTFANRTSTRNESTVMDKLKKSLQTLTHKSDFKFLPIHIKQQVADFLYVPREVYILETEQEKVFETAHYICLRNASNNKYLAYCDGYRLCSTEDEAPTVFQIERNKEKLISLYNSHHNMWIGFDQDFDDSMPVQAIVNYIDDLNNAYWYIQSNLDGSISFLNSQQPYYLCSGSDGESDESVYARRLYDWQEYSYECQWKVEECNSEV